MAWWLAALGTLMPWEVIRPMGAHVDQPIRAGCLCIGGFDVVDIIASFFNYSTAEMVLLEGKADIRVLLHFVAFGPNHEGDIREIWINGDYVGWNWGKATPLPCWPASAVLH